MKPSTLWLILFLVIGSSALYFTGKGGYELYRYYALSSRTKPTVFELSVKQIHTDLYVPEVEYEYNIEGKLYKNKEDLPDFGYFRGDFLEKDLPKIAKEKPWRVHYNPSSPAMSSLYRSYPFKDLLYGAIMIGIFLYFLALRKFSQ